jgi:hypothetical protein
LIENDLQRVKESDLGDPITDPIAIRSEHVQNVFSRRKGCTPPPVQGKLEEISDHTRNRLWDIFYIDIYRANQFDSLDASLSPGTGGGSY